MKNEQNERLKQFEKISEEKKKKEFQRISLKFVNQELNKHSNNSQEDDSSVKYVNLFFISFFRDNFYDSFNKNFKIT